MERWQHWIFAFWFYFVLMNVWLPYWSFDMKIFSYLNRKLVHEVKKIIGFLKKANLWQIKMNIEKPMISFDWNDFLLYVFLHWKSYFPDVMLISPGNAGCFHWESWLCWSWMETRWCLLSNDPKHIYGICDSIQETACY